MLREHSVSGSVLVVHICKGAPTIIAHIWAGVGESHLLWYSGDFLTHQVSGSPQIDPFHSFTLTLASLSGGTFAGVLGIMKVISLIEQEASGRH